MFWEKKLAQWVADMRATANLPARLVLWDGNQYDFGSDDFDYSAVLVHQPQGYTIQEGRNSVPGSRPFPIATHDLGLWLRPPLDASGLKLHDRLTAMTSSLERVEKGEPQSPPFLTSWRLLSLYRGLLP